MIRENHPYDQGYWARYDHKPRPSENPAQSLARKGWDDCNAELTFDLEQKVAALTAGKLGTP